MNKNRLWQIVALLMAVVLVLSACASPTTVAPTTAPEATEEPTSPPAAEEPTATTVMATEEPTVEPTVEATSPPAPEAFTFGILFVGPYNDRGWSQAHYEAGQYVEKNIPGAKMIYIDKVNSADRPGTTPQQLAEELVSQGAQTDHLQLG